jgi:hypothetical protein
VSGHGSRELSSGLPNARRAGASPNLFSFPGVVNWAGSSYPGAPNADPYSTYEPSFRRRIRFSPCNTPYEDGGESLPSLVAGHTMGCIGKVRLAPGTSTTRRGPVAV